MKGNLDIFKIRTNNIPPQKGRILIAEPFLHGDYFSRSVVFLVAHSEKGAVGFILNKQIDFRLQDVFLDFPEFDANVYLGGPVAADSIFFVHKLGEKLPGSIKVLENLYWGGDFETLKNLISNRLVQPSDINFFLGYSGWDAGQLEDEIKGDSWLVTDVDENAIMRESKDVSWTDFVVKAGNRYSIWQNYPENPSFN
ncbi:MAG TPA: YqgE/AlgH family protein [Draconibacterium sp.]|jgi:putative transcriptional regulator|nr:YqgE/AlgH family protein [Draconibacterium sp.]